VKIQKTVLSLLVLAFFISCSDENSSNNASAEVPANVPTDVSSDVPTIGEIDTLFTEQETKVLLRMHSPNNRVSIEEAIKLTNEFIDSFFDDERTLKSGTSRKISSVSALVSSSKPALKSGGIEIPDTLAYVFNFNDSLGFAIASADTRVDYPILAFTGSGSLMDSTDNPGMAIFLERLENYMLNSIAEAEHQKDSLLDGILVKLSKETDTKNTISPIDNILKVPSVRLLGISVSNNEYSNKVGPFMRVEWGQGTPYNNYVGGQCDNKTGNNKYWAGCVATAAAQMMSYWKYPALGWDVLNNYTAVSNRYKDVGEKSIANAPPEVKNALAALFQWIGLGVKMNYGCGGSKSSIGDALSFLRALGYKSTLMSYDSYNAMNFIVNAKIPLIAKGCSSKTDHKILGITYNTTYDGCHAWIMDGFVRRRATYYVAVNGASYIIDSSLDYIHNNWGWDSNHNGYFANGVFNSQDHTDNTFAPSNIKSGQPNNYQYDLQMAVIYL